MSEITSLLSLWSPSSLSGLRVITVNFRSRHQVPLVSPFACDASASCASRCERSIRVSSFVL
jgi:hypothetical protein